MNTIKKNLMRYQLIVATLALIGILYVSTACEEPVYEIEFFRSDLVHPAVGQTVVLSWKYSPDLDEALTEQHLEFLTVNFSPTGMSQQIASLSRDIRTHNLVFVGPVSILLVAKIGEHEIKAFLQLEPDPGSEGYHFTLTSGHHGYRVIDAATFERSQFYPDLAYPRTTTSSGGCNGTSTTFAPTKKISFSKFFGCYDGWVNYEDPERTRGGYDQIINSLQSELSNQAAFRALTTDAFEFRSTTSPEFHRPAYHVGFFKFRAGSQYPLVLFDPTGELITQNKFTNVIIFGGAIVSDGDREEIYKGNDGEGQTTLNVNDVQPIFMAITLYFPDHFAGQVPIVISDFQIGNLKQGLVATVMYNMISNQMGFDAASWTWAVNGTPSDYITSSFKWVTTGASITTLSGDLYNTFSELSEVSFKVPFYPDSRLEELLAGSRRASSAAFKGIKASTRPIPFFEGKSPLKPVEKKGSK